MKAITIENLVAHIRPLRTGKTFLSNFINGCEIIDVVPMKNIDRMKTEINQLELNGLWKPNYKEGFNDACYKIVHIINKYCKEK